MTRETPRTVSTEPLSWMPQGLAEPLAAAAAALTEAEHILVVAHERPDGDALGATLGLALTLQALGKTVTSFNVDPVPYNFEFLPGAEQVTARPPARRPDVTVVLDCAERRRVGAVPEAIWGRTIVCLDHHATFDPAFADVFVHDVEAAATGELVYRLLAQMGAPLSPEAATCLFCALQTDTGSFRYGNTSAGSLELGSKLLRTGIDVWTVSSAIYESQPLARIRLLSRVLETLHLSDCGRLASLVVSDAMLAETGADASMTDGFVNYARSIAGVEVATLLTGDGDGGYRVSFRSRGELDVARIAERFGGGGHRHAAGCQLSGDLESVRRRLDEALRELDLSP